MIIKPVASWANQVARIIVVSTFSVVISGCVGTDTFAPSAKAAEVHADTKVVKVSGKEITLGRAANYCFNDRQSRFTSAGAFVVMAPCDPLDEGSTAKGLILVNVLAEDGIMEAIQKRDLEAYFQSAAGRRALSRKGKADNLTVLGTMEDDGIYYVHTKDSDGPIIPDTTPDQWRLFFVVADRLISISVVNFVDDVMSDGMIFAHTEEVAQRILSLN